MRRYGAARLKKYRQGGDTVSHEASSCVTVGRSVFRSDRELPPCLIGAGACLLWFAATTAAAEPQLLDNRLELRLVARDPEIVTPIGMTFDRQGRMLVIESHTHFPAEDYAGPKSDRIRLIEDTNGDGRADRFRTFFEGTRSTMSIARGSGDWIYVATRMEVFRIADTNNDDVADVRERLAHLVTAGDYPHNGLCGLAFDQQGQLYFGLGENLGADYELIGHDGTRLVGGGEGGNIYRCTAEGDRLEQIATGFWNPFGICIDPAGRVFEVCNDPDASPPCRLVHVVPGGDYGYQFRYGRSGRHPLQAWNGELPGTLPMVAGTGEAPSDVIPYQGALWTTSWGDYRIERFRLEPRGASFTATAETVVQGDQEFRPVDFALGPDGALYFTDWVDKSYPVHGRGRIWRLTWKAGMAPGDDWPQLTDAEQQARRLEMSADLSACDTSDIFLRQAAVWGLLQSGTFDRLRWEDATAAGQRLGLMQAARWRGLQGADPPLDWIEHALRDDDADVRLYAVRWVADAGLATLRPQLEEQLTSRVTSPRLFQAALAALEWLDTGRVAEQKEPNYEHYLLRALSADNSPTAIRAMALRLIPPNHPSLTMPQLEKLAASRDEALRREAVRTLALRAGDEVLPALAAIATSAQHSTEERADAVAGMEGRALRFQPLLESLADEHATNALGREARRVLQSRPLPTDASVTVPTDSEIATLLGAVGEGGDPAAGWRLFFGARGATCANCHRFEGRGSAVGPDLTTVGKRLSRKRLLESLLDPSREVAPQYVPWVVQTTQGRVLTGLSLGKSPDGAKEEFLGADGRTFQVTLADVESRQASRQSIMPAGLAEPLSPAEIRDLLALLASSPD